MPAAADDMRRALTAKFGFTRTEGSKHEKFRLEIDGQYIAHTSMSRGSKDLGDPILGMMARQLGVTRGQLLRMLECTIGRDGYLQTVR